MNHIEFEKELFRMRIEIYNFARIIKHLDTSQDNEWYKKQLEELERTLWELRGKMYELIKYIEKNYYEV